MSDFRVVSQAEVLEVIKASAIKTSDLDPLPAVVFKQCQEVLLPVITEIINSSLSTGTVPPALKISRITPLLKKSSLDPESLQNYRPISNLPLLAKIMERVVARQLQKYLSENNLYAQMQSAYRCFHSTETALLRVNNDLLRAVDQHQEAVLLLLDLSAAFDTIDHEILLQRLQSRYGLSATALAWFASYLSNRVLKVSIKKTLSSECPLRFGVPQGSVVGPILFTMYSAPLQEIITAHGLNCLTYADDTQLYVIFHPDERQSALSKLLLCVGDIKSWLTSNKLKFNDSKTEVLSFSSRFLSSDAIDSITVGSSTIVPSPEARNLGVAFDSELCLTQHVNNICRHAALAIYKIGQIRKYLDLKTTERLIHAFVSSRIDYCNSLLYGLPQYQLNKIQRIQNSAAKLTVMKRDNVSSILNDLHWLPIAKRIEFKILLITFKCLNGLAPVYLSDLLTKYIPVRNLRSSSSNLLVKPRAIRTLTYGERAFSSAAPTLWNNLPAGLRSITSLEQFKLNLKTFLFTN